MPGVVGGRPGRKRHNIFYFCASLTGPWVMADKLGKYLLIDCKGNSSVPCTLLSLSGRKEKVIPAALASIPSPRALFFSWKLQLGQLKF